MAASTQAVVKQEVATQAGSAQAGSAQPAPGAGRQGDLWPEAWAIQASIEADRIHHRMRAAQLDPALDVRGRASVEAVTHHLDEARAACRRSRGRRRRGWRDRWRGTSVERAYRHLHTAKIFLLDLLPEPDVDAVIPGVSARLSVLCQHRDPRLLAAEKGLQSAEPVTRRAALKQAMEMSYDAADDEYARLRDFRNIVWRTAALIMAAMILLVTAVARAPHLLPLCFEGGADGPAAVCPSGPGLAPGWADVLVVAGLGALGGGLSAVLAIRHLRGTSTPYGLPVALAVLKIPSGSLVAVAGLLLLGGGFAPGFSDLDSQRQILAYALVLGYAQQLLTRLIDDRAQLILNKIPSKDPESRQPQATTATPPGGDNAPAAAGTAVRVAPPGSAGEPPPANGPAVADSQPAQQRHR